MLIKIREINRKSDPVPPRAGSRSNDPMIFWRMTVCEPNGDNPVQVFVTSSGGGRGRNYAPEQEYEMALTGGEIADNDGSVWQKAKLDRPGQAQQGARSGSGATAATGSGPKPAQGDSGRQRRPVPRDVYMAKMATLFFESAEAHCRARSVFEQAGHQENIDENAFWFQIGKVANQAAMSLGLECLPVSAAQKAKAEEEVRLKAEAEAKAEADRKAEEARQRLKAEQEQEQELDWD